MTIFQLILVQVVAFILIVIGLRKLLYSHISTEKQRLQLMIDASNKKVEVLRGQIEEAKTEYDRKIAQAKADAQKLIADAQKEAEELKAKHFQETRRETDKMVKAAQAKTESMQREIHSMAARKGIHFSKAIIKQALTADCLGAAHDVMIEEISKQIVNVDLSQLREGIKEVEIVTTFPLEKERKEMLRQKLSSKLKMEVELTEKIDDSVIAGILIKLGSLILDGSLANKLRIAAEQLEKEHSA
ncbi:MAG: F0F1 ATP synthase subunit delta [Lentisphaerae bacterium]|nr:F0F1 ATP synthase subunit delta [Lentisphaerota bacterium]